jgi:hypothetical protein
MRKTEEGERFLSLFPTKKCDDKKQKRNGAIFQRQTVSASLQK